jgi:hypothetical protein
VVVVVAAVEVVIVVVVEEVGGGCGCYGGARCVAFDVREKTGYLVAAFGVGILSVLY